MSVVVVCGVWWLVLWQPGAWAQQTGGRLPQDVRGKFASYYLDSTRKQTIRIADFQQAFPSADVRCNGQRMKAHNNVDLIRYNGYFYAAYRTAPFHFASDRARIEIARSVDGRNWACIHTLHLGTDLREPRFYVHDGQLHLVFCQLGISMFKFQPRTVWVTRMDDSLRWSPPHNTCLEGYVPWRVRNHQTGQPLLSAYYGVDLYKHGNHAGIQLFATTNGLDWQTLTPEPQVVARGAEEGEFIFDAQGHLWATVRLEGAGGLLAWAPADEPTRWQTLATKYKFDSALLFEHRTGIYLIARRNVDGTAEKNPWWLPRGMRRGYNLLRYSLTPKRTALYRYDTQNKQIVWLMDLPSTGDTAFAGIAPLTDDPNPDAFLVLNYSNDPWKKDRSWLNGQLGTTNLYAFTLSFETGITQDSKPDTGTD
jgi:hypothetical protein